MSVCVPVWVVVGLVVSGLGSVVVNVVLVRRVGRGSVGVAGAGVRRRCLDPEDEGVTAVVGPGGLEQSARNACAWVSGSGGGSR